MDIEEKAFPVGRLGKTNCGSVSSIIQQLESGNKPLRLKPPVPPTKSSSSANCAASSNRDSAEAPGEIVIDKNQKELEENIKEPQVGTFSRAGAKSCGDINGNSSPFSYAAPDSVISKIGTLTDEGTRKKVQPLIPPRPNFTNGGHGNNGERGTKVEAKKTTWRKIEDRWVPVTGNCESTASEKIPGLRQSFAASDCNRDSVCTTDSNSTKGSSDNDADVTCESHPSAPSVRLMASPPSCSFTKPAPLQHHYIRKSTEGCHSPVRRGPPLLPAKPPTLRKYGPSTNSVVSSTGSVPSLSDEVDSDVENGNAANSASREDCIQDRENSFQSNTEAVAPTSTLTREQKAFRCAEEFLTSEKSYVRTLEVLSEDFPKFMKSQSDALNRPLVEPDVPTIIASYLHELRELHRMLAKDFQARLDNWDSHPHLADILSTKGPFLKMSTRFLQQKEELATQVLNACKRYPDFHTALTAFEKDHFEGLHLVHKLDSVHQRLCRYPLLLCSYLKYLSPDTAEYEAAQKAKEFINSITLELENSLKDQDGTRILCELYRRIVQSRFEVIEPGRKLLKEGPILKYSRKERQNRHLILFNDVLLCCASVVAGSNLLRVRYVFELKDPGTSVSVGGDDEQDPNTSGWEFVVKGRQKSIIFIADCAAEGKAWVKAIQNAIGLLHRKSSDFTPPRASVYSSGESAVDDTWSNSTGFSQQPPTITDCVPSDLGKLAPVWTPDQRVTMCQCCGVAFTTIRRRRHHCRACGRVICDECSGKAPLEFLDFKEERVCPNCYTILYERTKQGSYMEEVLDRTVLTASQVMALYVAPKNRFHVDSTGGAEFHIGPNSEALDDEEETILMKGYLRLSRNRQQWKRYWTVVKEMGVMEFYKAVNDRKYDTKVVLLGWQAKAVDGEEFIFKLFHTNQFNSTTDHQLPPADQEDANMHYWLKADDAETMDRWLAALDAFFDKFVS